MGAVAIRPGRTTDMVPVTAIYRHAVLHGTGTFELDPPNEAEMIARFVRITALGYPYLVACEGKAVVGYAYVAAYRERPAYRFTVENSIYVHPHRHGFGIGQALLAQLVAATEAGGYRQMVAVIGDSDNRGSVRLHEKAGFLPLGTLRACGWKHGRWLDVVLMQRALGPGDTVSPVAP